jgi:phosphoribosyl-dephospho-CoA transferase
MILDPLNPHDLVWCDDRAALDFGVAPLPSWLATDWDASLPLVVRRAPRAAGHVPVGIRGSERKQRHPAQARLDRIGRRVTPQQIAAARGWRTHPRLEQLPPLIALVALAPELDRFGIDWGITGAAGFELACGRAALRPASDLDLTFRCPAPLEREEARAWAACLAASPCRIDVQIETPHGGFALAEWLRGGRTLLKTDRGPQLVADPWHPDTMQEITA